MLYAIYHVGGSNTVSLQTVVLAEVVQAGEANLYHNMCCIDFSQDKCNQLVTRWLAGLSEEWYHVGDSVLQ